MANWSYGNYAKDKSFNVRAASYSLTFLLALYYAVVLFHLPYPFMNLRSGSIEWGTALPFLYIWFLFVLGGLGMKGGYLLRASKRGTPLRQSLSVVGVTTFYLIGFQGLMLLALAAATYGPQLLGSAYFQRSHLFWMAVMLAVACYPIPKMLRRYQLIRWQTLSDLKALPFASPAFCFGLPVLLKSNISPLPIAANLLATYAILSFVSGTIFLIFLIYYALASNFVMRDPPAQGGLALTPELARQRSDVRDQQIDRLTISGFALIGTATFLVMLAVIDLLIVATLSGIPSNTLAPAQSPGP